VFKKIALALAILITLLLLACSENPPQIIQVQWQVILFQNRLLNAVYPKLSIFIRATDEDGMEDLNAIYFINDEAELYWSLLAEKWDKASVRGVEWIGSNGLVMPDKSPLPAGTYRILLEDLSGQTAETQIYLKREELDFSRAVFPAVTVTDNVLSLSGNFSQAEIWLYDSNDQFRKQVSLPGKTISLSELTKHHASLEKGFSFYVFTKKTDTYYAMLEGPFYFTREQVD